MTPKELMIGLRKAGIATMVACILGVPVNLVLGGLTEMSRITYYAFLIVFWIIGFVVFMGANRKLREMSDSN